MRAGQVYKIGPIRFAFRTHNIPGTWHKEKGLRLYNRIEVIIFWTRKKYMGWEKRMEAKAAQVYTELKKWG